MSRLFTGRRFIQVSSQQPHQVFFFLLTNPVCSTEPITGGNLIIWNLCHSVVEPVGEFNVQHDQSPESKPKSNTLSKAVWLDDGRKLLVGEARLVMKFDCNFSYERQ